MRLLPNAAFEFRFWVQSTIIDTAATDPHQGETGLVESDFDLFVAKPGAAAFAAVDPADYTLTEIGRGWYKVVVTTTTDFIDTTLGPGTISIDYSPAALPGGYVAGPVWEKEYNVGYDPADTRLWLGIPVGGTSIAGPVMLPHIDLHRWITGTPAALSANGFIQAMLMRWLTDNAAGTPDTLVGGDVSSDINRWLGSIVAPPTVAGVPEVDLTHYRGTQPAAIVGDKIPVLIARLLTDDAAGTPNALNDGDFPSNVLQWRSNNVAIPTVGGIPEVDVTYFGGTLAPAPSVPGIPLTESSGGGGGGGGVNPSLGSKVQFVSNEELQIVFPPFINMSTGARHIGTDAVTLVIKRPDGTLLAVPPVPVFDTDVQLWVATIPFASFMEGKWMIRADSDGANTMPQNQVLTWGDYVDDIPETRQAALGRWRIDAATKKLFLYEDDGTTVFREFDLKDSSGNPSVTQIFERDPV